MEMLILYDPGLILLEIDAIPLSWLSEYKIFEDSFVNNNSIVCRFGSAVKRINDSIEISRSQTIFVDINFPEASSRCSVLNLGEKNSSNSGRWGNSHAMAITRDKNIIIL